jgi:hypothetical protein
VVNPFEAKSFGMNLLAIFRAVIGLASILADIVREKQLMDAGEAKATAKSLAALSSRLGIAQAVADEVAALSDDEINADLRGE